MNLHSPSNTHTHTRLTALLSGTTRVGRYQKGKTKLDFTEARESEWQWHPLGHMQVCTSLHADNHASTPPLSFLQAGCPSCRPANIIKALKALIHHPCQTQNKQYTNYWLYFDVFVFYDWPFPHVYFAKNVAYFPF